MVFWIFTWPVVLTVNIVAAATRRGKLATGVVYFVVLAVLGAIAVAQSRALSWGQFLVLWALLNLPATILLLAFLHRRVRAVGPLLVTFMLFAALGANLVLFLMANEERVFDFFFELGWGLGLGASAIAVGVIVVGLGLFGIAGSLALRWAGRMYARKRVSDESITLEAIWLMFATIGSIPLAFEASRASRGSLPGRWRSSSTRSLATQGSRYCIGRQAGHGRAPRFCCCECSPSVGAASGCST